LAPNLRAVGVEVEFPDRRDWSVGRRQIIVQRYVQTIVATIRPFLRGEQTPLADGMSLDTVVELPCDFDRHRRLKAR
jgi:hypothetical protein